MFSFLEGITYRLPAIVLALTVHEFSHAYAAYLLGDPTARNQGRLSLNPLVHLDPIGFVCLLFFRFGWAKPVPFNPYNFDSVDEKTGGLLTALAGPMSNILMCFIAVGIFILTPARVIFRYAFIYGFLNYFIWINASLAFFNLIPVPPLDGSKILFGILPDRLYYLSHTLERYGFLFLMLLLWSSIPSVIISPLTRGLVTSFSHFFRIFL